MNNWLFIHEKLRASVPVIVLWVLDSEGSSPGRRGFKMVVAGDGQFSGTIGGGMMEHKMVEKARSLLNTGLRSVLLQRQYHDKSHQRDQSGMICSGSQLIAFVPLQPEQADLVGNLLAAFAERRDTLVALNPEGIATTGSPAERIAHFTYEDEDHWSYAERLDQRPVIHIIGAGHVGRALSQQMTLLNFYIKLYDNRPALNTFLENSFAHEKIVADYEKMEELIGDAPDDFVVIMTFGYRDDKTVFRQLAGRRFRYLGMLGSEVKTITLIRELGQEGLPADTWEHCFVPVGLPIYSKTAAEIAVSIAAEIIREKNRDLPTGRNYVTSE